MSNNFQVYVEVSRNSLNYIHFNKVYIMHLKNDFNPPGEKFSSIQDET